MSRDGTSVQGMAPSCHPERSEGSVRMGVEMLRCAQHDRAVLLARHRHLSAFRLQSPLLAIPAPPAVDGLFARLMPIGDP